MRAIKFRAWDKVSRLWLDTEEYVIHPDNGDVGEVERIKYPEIVDVNHDAVLEQYTGLEDVNGVEIYEGDILKDVDNGNIVGYVEYDDAFGEYDCGDNNLYECTRDCQVIGNIHEQPELLEEK